MVQLSLHIHQTLLPQPHNPLPLRQATGGGEKFSSQGGQHAIGMRVHVRVCVCTYSVASISCITGKHYYRRADRIVLIIVKTLKFKYSIGFSSNGTISIS